ncbi:hypothetical protein ABZ490_25695 [Streptomyces sp. NPDC005811]|uniref:hypothetical protein n=1 Tax=Streptomyces sp. NPDC005811 TaxID=3154565 RepID=UPI0033DF071C
MWPGEQPPAGGPGGPAQPNPYAQPGPQGRQPAWNPPTGPPAPPPSGGSRTKVVAAAVAGAVLVAAVVTGAVLLIGGSGEPGPAPASSSASASADPRADATSGPTVAGWKVVVNPERGIAFDVPADWALKSTSWVSYVAEDDDPDDTPLVGMKAPAVLREKWCTSDDDRDGKADDTSLASAGSRGNDGAKSTGQIAKADSAAWVYGAYAQPDHAKVTTGPVTSFTTASGLEGSVATSRSSGVDRKGTCDSDGKATTFAFRTPDGDLASWSFVGASGVDEEVPDATVRKIMGTVRVFEPSGS